MSGSSAARRGIRRAGAWMGAGILKGSRRLGRLQRLNPEREQLLLQDYPSIIYAVWHGRFWVPITAYAGRGVAVLVSRSEDGEVIARAAQRLGYVPVRGSSSRGGREGLAALAAKLEGGRSVALTPDGPRGPRHVAQMGTVALAARTGRPILPLGAASRHAWTMNSWDAFQVPRPLSLSVLVYGDPLLVPPAEDLEPWRAQLDQRLREAEANADAAVGR